MAVIGGGPMLDPRMMQIPRAGGGPAVGGPMARTGPLAPQPGMQPVQPQTMPQGSPQGRLAGLQPGMPMQTQGMPQTAPQRPGLGGGPNQAQIDQFTQVYNQRIADQQTAERPFATAVGADPMSGLLGASEAVNRGASGSISALEEFLGEARGEIGAGRERALSGIQDVMGQATQPFEGFTGGQQAQQQQAALSGALGPEAQAAAIQAFQESPQQAFLREQGERAITRNAAALGGLGGGEVRKELMRFGTGLAAQDFANQFNRLGNVADRGLQAASGRGNLLSNQAGLQTGVETGATEGISGLLAGQGGRTADIMTGAGATLAGLRERAGNQLASAISGTTSSLAGLQDEQGRALADLTGESTANLANLFNLAGQGDAQSQERLAGIMANLNQDEAALLANLFAGQGSARLTGDMAGAAAFRDLLGNAATAAGNIFS